jgi:diaminopimelate decarboxylase
VTSLAPSPFAYRDGVLHAEDVPLDRLVSDVDTPVYVYSAGGMRARLAALLRAFAHQPVLVCYAVKANHNLAVIRTLAQAGAGADTVSGGEIERAVAAGVAPSRIVFAGVAKTDAEIRMALRARIHQFNVESLEELLRIDALARAEGSRAPVAFRINPDVGAGGHDKISTGRKGDKFGVPLAEIHEAVAQAARLPGIEPVGLHVHIGSQITRLDGFEAAFRKAAGLLRELRAAGHPLRRLDLGGGLGVRYLDEVPIEPQAYAAMVARALDGLDCELVLEPGRWLVAEAGVLVSRVVFTKAADGRAFLVLDAGMNALLRPAMYGARHAILPVRGSSARKDLLPMDVVGPICESSDLFGRDYLLPPLVAGDLVAIMSAGAYGATMVSDYNSRPSPAEVLVDGEKWAVVRRRRLPADQFRDESVPAWLGTAEPPPLDASIAPAGAAHA